MFRTHRCYYINVVAWLILLQRNILGMRNKLRKKIEWNSIRATNIRSWVQIVESFTHSRSEQNRNRQNDHYILVAHDLLHFFSFIFTILMIYVCICSCDRQNEVTQKKHFKSQLGAIITPISDSYFFFSFTFITSSHTNLSWFCEFPRMKNEIKAEEATKMLYWKIPVT